MTFEAEVILGLAPLRRYARALTGDPAWADDLVQDTAERALARVGAFRQGTNVRAWLFTILRHIYIDQFRARREIACDDDTAPWHNMEAPREVVDGLVLRDLQRALYHLPLEQREVLLLVGVEELSYQEAASVLGVPIGTVMSRLSRAREHLRLLLGGEAAHKHAPLKVVRKTP
ncbi:sigma-70 family RNA polymerase sigma factor [Trinickia soli]|uniref:RNA polymerase subunit sigma-24 n=1 Tax=Trinickia soli TaxID=380675 RepID=A0A2N7WGA7_9BURK|nr:sigma-70 family RNA polymerase sigma factor [Trinickia soli]KAA0087824.1 sigma-70 family RNA polymerase sigma factor [Paraburkholderia sp. T12-10]PMS28447.1 RNA polymerase subunit sigma-24 [Trinickia soli]CAB3670178.1 ECF RNA polymerase sigma factor EcfG [Trinickia soli]